MAVVASKSLLCGCGLVWNMKANYHYVNQMIFIQINKQN